VAIVCQIQTLSLSRRGRLLLRASIVLVALAALLTPAAHARPAAAGEPLTARLARALAVPNVNHSRSAALVVDLTTGRVLFARNTRLSLAPASTEKLALSYALLKTVGPAYRIRTQVLAKGFREGSTWYGDLVLRGYGDPTLSSAGLRRLALRIRALGIRRVTGWVYGDESFFDTRRTAPGWKPYFYIRESEPLSALAVDHGRIGGNVSAHPALAAALGFRAILASAGVAVAGPAGLGRAAAEDVQLASTSSPPLLHMLRLVNRESDNFTAELLLKHLGGIDSGRGTTGAGATVVRRVLEASGVPLHGVRIVDGSGLSLLDRQTAESLVGILSAAWADPLLRGSFLASLAVAGRNGTLRGRLRRGPASGNVYAKTGTTALSSALSGYVGGRYVFAVVHNGPPLSAWWCREAQDRFVTVLASGPG